MRKISNLGNVRDFKNILLLNILGNTITVFLEFLVTLVFIEETNLYLI